MGRRNYPLILSLLVMVAALIGAILFGRGGPDGPVPTPPAGVAGAAGATVAGDDARTAGADVASESTEPGERGAAAAARSALGDAATQRPRAGGGPIEIRGRLVDAAGAPATDCSMSFSRFLDFSADELDPSEVSERLDAWNDIRPDDEGRFRFEVEPGTRGALTLRRSGNRLFAAEQRRELSIPGYAQDRDLGDIAVCTAASITGRVVDESGRAVEGARVRAGLDGTVWSFGSPAVTDADGRFEIVGLRAGQHSVQASASGYVPLVESVAVEIGEQRDDVVLAMHRGASIAGNVVDDQGRPIDGAKIAIYRDQELGADFSVESLDENTAVETDEHGYFLLSGVDGAAVQIRAWAQGHSPERLPQVTVGTGNLVVRLQRLGRVAGVLVDGGGAPVAGSQIVASRGLLSPSLELELARMRGAITDEHGRFEIDDVRPGTATLTARGDGHLPVEGFSVQVRPGETTDNVRLVADRGAAVSVLVVDVDGAPVPGAKVRVTEPAPPTADAAAGGRQRYRTRTRTSRDVDEAGDVETRYLDGPEVLAQGMTDDEGRVRIVGLPAGAVELSTRHAEHAPSRPTNLTLPRRGVVEAVLTMRPGGFVEVRSVRADGTPEPQTRFRIRGPIVAGVAPDTDTHSTDGSGLMRLGPLPVGSYELTVELPPRPVQLGESMMFTSNDEGTELAESVQPAVVSSGETVEVTLVRPVLTRLYGTVSDAEGPVRGVELRIRQEGDDDPLGRRGFTAKSADGGRYEIDDLPPGKYRLEFQRKNQIVAQLEHVEVLPNQAEIQRDLVLRGGTVRVTALSADDGLPVERAEVALEREGEGARPARQSVIMVRVNVERDADGGTSTISMGDGRRSVETDDDGVAVLESVPPGRYTAVVRHGKHVVERLEGIDVRDRATVEAGPARLRPAGYVRGKVTGFPDDATGMALVEMTATEPGVEPWHETAMNGAFKIDSVAPGRYQLRARPLGPGVEEQWGPIREVVVEAGEPSRVELPLR